MKSDLDFLMEKNDIDVLFVTGSADHNPAMVYFTGNAHVSSAILIKKRGSQPVLFHFAMEREEAAKSGLELVSFTKYPYEEFLKESGGNHLDAEALRTRRMFQDLGINRGRVAIYGKNDTGPLFAILNRVQELMPDLKFEGFIRDEILFSAMMTKDEKEVERIRKMGKITVEVVAKTADFLTGHRTHGETLVHQDGSPVTIGEVKNLINLWLAERGAENPEGTIFTIGRDAGVPHSTGNPSDPLRLGQTIIFDIYPCEPGGGYFYDFTRTWSLGYASDKAQQLYDDVRSTYETLKGELRVNAPFHLYQERTCELFKALGHPTIKEDPATEVGYVHSLGHGVGLHIHEKPFSGLIDPALSDILAPGAVFTLEPGLYYPERGMGVRIEDTLWVTPDGRFETLAEFPKDLVLPIK